MYEVLIVEDDPMVAVLDRQYVHQNPHFHVAGTCRDGRSGLKFLLEHTVHLVILDVYMPESDGMMLLREIRRRGLKVSVIMVTAANDTDTVEEALRLGIVDYLVKPFESGRFNQALETFRKREDALHDLSVLDQSHIDSMLGNRTEDSEYYQPKGILDQTLNIICEFLKDHSGEEFTGDEIAARVGLSRVTVRRYMNYLSERHIISERMNYETGGRPGMLFRWNL